MILLIYNYVVTCAKAVSEETTGRGLCTGLAEIVFCVRVCWINHLIILAGPGVPTVFQEGVPHRSGPFH